MDQQAESLATSAHKFVRRRSINQNWGYSVRDVIYLLTTRGVAQLRMGQ